MSLDVDLGGSELPQRVDQGTLDIPPANITNVEDVNRRSGHVRVYGYLRDLKVRAHMALQC